MSRLLAMPAYDYQCQDCGNGFTLRWSISAYTAGVNAECPACGSDHVTRRLGAVNVLGGSRAGGSAPATGCGSSGFT
jgi:putative FmdB family regulatory protein